MSAAPELQFEAPPMPGVIEGIHLGDCLEVAPRLFHKAFDMVFCDLPYERTRAGWDMAIDFKSLWDMYDKVCRDNAVLVFTAMQPFSSALVISNVDCFRHSWVWEKNKASGHLNAKRAPMRAHEDVLVFAYGEPHYCPQMTSGHRPGNYAKRAKQSSLYSASNSTEYGGQTTRYPRSVQQFAVVNNDNPERIHPTQKPVEMVRYFIETYSLPGARVLDNCMGSGTTGIACLESGRRFVGIEKDPDIFNRASARLAEVMP